MFRVASKLADVLLHPFQSLALVTKPVVGINLPFASEKPVRSYAVVEGNDDDAV